MRKQMCFAIAAIFFGAESIFIATGGGGHGIFESACAWVCIGFASED